jgi:hypothetical protein
VHAGGGRVARRSGIHHGDGSQCPSQDEGGGQAGGTPADHGDVVFVDVREVHVLENGRRPRS